MHPISNHHIMCTHMTPQEQIITPKPQYKLFLASKVGAATMAKGRRHMSGPNLEQPPRGSPFALGHALSVFGVHVISGPPAGIRAVATVDGRRAARRAEPGVCIWKATLHQLQVACTLPCQERNRVMGYFV